MQIKRREFLKQSALGVGAVLAGARMAAAQDAKPAAPFDAYQDVVLGQSKLKVSRLCLGTGASGWQGASNQTRLGKDKFEALLKGAYDRGVRMFDLADLYGTHPYLIPALQGIPRDKFTIVSKIWFAPGGLPGDDRPDADVVVPRFLKELRTDYIDLLLLHCVTSASWPADLRKQMDILSKYKEKGVVRAVGVSCHSLPALEAAAAEPWVDSVHARINPYGMSMDGQPEKVVPVLRKLRAAGKGVVGMKVVGNGNLRHDQDRREQSVRFALHLDCVDVLNVGCENLDEVDDMAACIRKVPAKV